VDAFTICEYFVPDLADWMGSRSLVIDTLRKGLENNSKPKIGLAYVYCDYRDQDQTIEKILSAIVKQLLEPLDVIPERIDEIYKGLRKAGKQISLPDASEMLLHACKAFHRVYICVDALDELEERDKLLKSLQETPHSICLFTTGRNNVKNTVRLYFEEAMVLQIKANENDIRSLVKDKISISCREVPELMDENLEHDIIEKIVDRSTGKLVTPFLPFKDQLLTTSQLSLSCTLDTNCSRC
jgi:hypothetical protein